MNLLTNKNEQGNYRNLHNKKSKNSNLSKIVFLGLLSLGLILLGGCSRKENFPAEEKKAMALEYMQEKYGEEFVGIKYNFDLLVKSWDEYYVYPKSRTPEDMVKVSGTWDEKGKYELSDSYFELLIKDRYEEYVEEIIQSRYSDYHLKITPRKFVSYAAGLNRDTEVEDMANKAREDKRPTYEPEVVLSLPEKTFQQKTPVAHANELAEIFQQRDVAIKMIISIIRDEFYEEYKAMDGDIYIGTEVESKGDRSKERDEEIRNMEAAEDKYYAQYSDDINFGILFYVNLDKNYENMIIEGEDLMRGESNE